MKKYTITVNGTPYDVTVDESGSSSNASAPVTATAPVATPAAAPVAAQAPAAPVASTAPAAGAVKIESPMPGTILDVKVNAGDTVSAGQVLCVLEAMKMENDIVAPQDGTVASVTVKKGDSVEAGSVLLSIN